MINYQDDYSQLVLAKTLAHFHQNINKQQLSKGGYRNFADFILQWMLMPHVEVHIGINRSNVDENGIANEINFCWHFLNEEVLNEAFSLLNDKTHSEAPYYYNMRLDSFRNGRRMVGALINHGTATEPNWGSHT
jgi:hypothetical protein